MLQSISISRPIRLIAALLAAVIISGCATTQDVATRTDGINDPYEQQNRNIHAFNKGFDKNVFRPVAKGYGNVPVEMRDTVNNFAENLSTPGYAINSLLQGDLESAGVSTLRFVINTTIGLAGLFDAASELKLPARRTDFGETMTVWGSGEGAYIELPFLGPSTQRDTTGLIVDFFTNPFTFATVDEVPRLVPPGSRGVAALNDREKFSDQIDGVLYESADSYAQSRQIYLQNRRFELGQNDADDFDPYEDPYGQ